jgi:hypothetical protein
VVAPEQAAQAITASAQASSSWAAPGYLDVTATMMALKDDEAPAGRRSLVTEVISTWSM